MIKTKVHQDPQQNWKAKLSMIVAPFRGWSLQDHFNSTQLSCRAVWCRVVGNYELVAGWWNYIAPNGNRRESIKETTTSDLSGAQSGAKCVEGSGEWHA